MEKIVVADGADFAVAEKSAKANVAEVMLHKTGIMIGGATAKAAAVHGIAVERFTGAMHQLVHILAGGTGVAALKLECLPDPHRTAHSDAAGVGICADEIADKEIAAMKFFHLFVDHQAHE